MDEYDDNTTDEQQDSKDRNWRRDLERRAREGDEAKARVAELERREAFREAGLDLSKPGVGYFLKGYDGELTPAAIKDAATEAGFLSATESEPQPESEAPTPAQQGMDALTAMAGSAAPPEGVERFRADAEKAYQEGGMEAMLDVVQKYGVPVTTRQ